MSRIPACCCGNSNTVIFSDLRAAGHTGIYSDTIQVGHCYPVSISIRLHLPSPPPQWFRKVKQWSKEGLKFFAGALPSANNMGDFSLQCVGVHFMTKNNCVKTLTLPHPCVRKSTTLVKRHDTARDRAQKSTRSPTFSYALTGNPSRSRIHHADLGSHRSAALSIHPASHMYYEGKLPPLPHASA